METLKALGPLAILGSFWLLLTVAVFLTVGTQPAVHEEPPPAIAAPAEPGLSAAQDVDDERAGRPQ